MIIKILKYAIGTLGAAFGALHVVLGVRALLAGETAGVYTATTYGAHIVGICLGFAVAIVCFKPKDGGGAERSDGQDSM